MLTCVSGNRQIDIDDFQSEEQLFELRELSNKGLLRCPDPRCGGIVILHKCNLKRSHFAHRIVGEQCRVCEESAEHDFAKSWIYHILRNQYPSECVKKEAFVESGQKADIFLITPTKKFAIEIQFSPQSDEVWTQRTADYRKAGIIPVWIIGIKNELASVLKAANNYYEHDFSVVKNLEFYERNILRNITFRPTWENSGVEMRQGSTLSYLTSNRDRPAIYHFISVINKESTFEHHLYCAVIWKENVSRHTGLLLNLDDEISFSETEERFISKAEVDYSNLLAARKAEQAIEDEKRRIKLLQKREQKYRFINHMLKEFQIEALDQFPEVKTQKVILRQNKNYRRLFHDNKSVYPNEDYLLIELAVYVKFIKRSRAGSKFDMDDIKLYLDRWGLWDEVRFQSINAWVAGLLQKLVVAEVLSKSKVDHKPAWVVLTTDLLSFFMEAEKSNIS